MGDYLDLEGQEIVGPGRSGGGGGGGGAFDVQSDVDWHSLFYVEGAAFAEMDLADEDALSDGTGWPNETAEADCDNVVGAGVTYEAASAILNGQPCVSFDGASYVDTDGGWTGDPIGPVSIAVVVGLAGSSHERICGSHESGAFCKLWRHGTAGNWYIAAGSDANTGETATSATPHILVAYYNNGGNDKLYLNGSLVFDGSAGTTGGILDGIMIGTYQDSTSMALQGDVGFLGVFEGDLSADDSWDALHEWAADKYGVTLA